MLYLTPSSFTFFPRAATLWCGFALGASVFCHSVDAARVYETNVSHTNQIIVKWRMGQAAAQLNPYARIQQPGSSLQFVRDLSDGSQVFQVAPDQQAEDVVQALSQLPEVENVQFDPLLQIAQVPNDPRYNEQWGLFEAVGGLNLPEAWDVTTGSKEMVVAVVDTGVLPHADLKGQILPGYDFISSPMIANDGDGRDPDPTDPGDWIDPFECSLFQMVGRDSSWHGTHVAGIIAAKANNAEGVAGVAWGVKILPVRVMGKCGGYQSDIIDGIRWAAGLAVEGVPANPYPAKVINISLGGAGPCSTAMQNAVTEVIKQGTVLVVAAGNEGKNFAISRPANCAGVVVVAANSRAGGLAPYSNFGKGVTVTAPGGRMRVPGDGGGILSTLNEGTTVPAADSYGFYQGTSMAAPHVSGVVALVMSMARNITPVQVMHILKRSSRAFPKGVENACDVSRCGAGIVDAGAAVKNAEKLASPRGFEPLSTP